MDIAFQPRLTHALLSKQFWLIFSEIISMFDIMIFMRLSNRFTQRSKQFFNWFNSSLTKRSLQFSYFFRVIENSPDADSVT